MSEEILDFTAAGAPRILAGEIEQYAIGRGSLNAIVVPWESDRVTLSMAVTSAKGTGWAIEHTNLGTIKLTDLGNGLTRITVAAQQSDPKLAALLNGFASQIQSKFQVAS